MNKLPRAKRIAVVAALTEGNSLRSTVRMTGVAMNTCMKLLRDAGPACARYQAEAFNGLECKRFQVDEMWGFVGCKQSNVPAEMKGQWGIGDAWLWSAICADCKVVPSWLLGPRDAGSARDLLGDLADRLAGRIQLTTDGLSLYVNAVDESFGSAIDYCMLVKLYGEEAGVGPERRYSPGECCGTRREVKQGRPDQRHVSTSFVERLHLTNRQHMKRFARLTLSFSKKVENLTHATALHYLAYNFVKVHRTLRVTPAMQAEVTSRLWTVEDIVDVLEWAEGGYVGAGPE